MAQARASGSLLQEFDFALNLPRTSLNFVNRFLAALNLFKGPGLEGKTFLMSSADIAFHFSREKSVMQDTFEERPLVTLPFCKSRICWIQGKGSPLRLNRGMTQLADKGVVSRIETACPMDSQNSVGLMRIIGEFTLLAKRASTRNVLKLDSSFR